MKKIVVPTGQTCNKFFCLLPPLAHAVRTGERITVLLPDKALADYPRLTDNPYLSFPLWNARLAKLVGYKNYEDWTLKLYSRFLKKNPLIPASYKKNIVWNAWDERALEVDDALLEVVRKIFSPREEIRAAVDTVWKDARGTDPDTIIIGCHFRRGDYKEWHGGKYYFDNEDWRGFMAKLVEMFPGKNIRFFISSNEKITPTDFPAFYTFTLQSATTAVLQSTHDPSTSTSSAAVLSSTASAESSSSAVDLLGAISSPSADLYALSLCDYIIGPPSTFSNWAALIARRPLCHITSRPEFVPKFTIPRSNIGCPL